MSEDFERIQQELNCLTETAQKINGCQNELQKLDSELKFRHEYDKKCLLDLRLKFGIKIEEATIFYKALSDAENEKLQMKVLQKQLVETQEILNNSLSEISPDISDSKSYEIKTLREKINQLKLNIQLSSMNVTSKTNTAANIKKKYQRSIDTTTKYFLLKDQSMKNTKFTIDLINKYRDELNSLRQQYSTHMSNLETISSEIHLQRATQNLVESRLSQRLPDSELSSIGSFNLDDDDDDNNDYADNRHIKLPQATMATATHTHLSLSQHHISSLCDYTTDCNLPSPCRSLNIPFHQGSGTVVSRTANITWHPLL